MPIALIGIVYAFVVELFALVIFPNLDLSFFDMYLSQHLMVTSFLLTFYLSSAHSARQNLLGYVRSVQGRANDMMLLVATHTRDSDEECRHYAARAADYILAALWATYANLDSTLREDAVVMLRTLLDREELKVVIGGDATNPTLGLRAGVKCLNMLGRHHTCGRQQGLNTASDVLAGQFFDNLLRLRGSLGSMVDAVDDNAGVAFAYQHLLLFNTTCLLTITPLGLASTMGWYSLVGTPLIYITYAGVLVLGRVMTKPYEPGHYEHMQISLRAALREHMAHWNNHAAGSGLVAVDPAAPGPCAVGSV